VPVASKPQAGAIVVVHDKVLAASLELALIAGGLNAIIFDPTQGLEQLPLDVAMTLIVDAQLLERDPAVFVSSLRARPWEGLVVLMTGDGKRLQAAFARSQRIAVLEMPFVGADLIAAVRTVWPCEDKGLRCEANSVRPD
jgi:FixJ family two-component response regulator